MGYDRWDGTRHPIRPGMLALGEYLQIKATGGVGYPAHHLGYLDGELHGNGRAMDLALNAYNAEDRRVGDAVMDWLIRYEPWVGSQQLRWGPYGCWDYNYSPQHRQACQNADHMNHIHVGLDLAHANDPNLVNNLPSEAKREADSWLGGPQPEEDIVNELQNAVLTKIYTRTGWLQRRVKGLSKQGRRQNQLLKELDRKADEIIAAYAEANR